MPIRSIRYKFSQHFNVPAEEAYKWCTDYDPNDLPLMGEKGKRKIEWIADDALMLIDSTQKNGGTLSKKKLVRLFPSTLSWTNTHVAGPYKYSQFLYKIISEGKSASRLEFTGLQLENYEEGDKQNLRSLSSRLRKEDSGAWKLLAKQLEKDLRTKEVVTPPCS